MTCMYLWLFVHSRIHLQLVYGCIGSLKAVGIQSRWNSDTIFCCFRFVYNKNVCVCVYTKFLLNLELPIVKCSVKAMSSAMLLDVSVVDVSERAGIGARANWEEKGAEIPGSFPNSAPLDSLPLHHFLCSIQALSKEEICADPSSPVPPSTSVGDLLCGQ